MPSLVEALRLSLSLLLSHPRRALAVVLVLTSLGETVARPYTYYLPLVLN